MDVAKLTIGMNKSLKGGREVITNPGQWQVTNTLLDTLPAFQRQQFIAELMAKFENKVNLNQDYFKKIVKEPMTERSNYSQKMKYSDVIKKLNNDKEIILKKLSKDPSVIAFHNSRLEPKFKNISKLINNPANELKSKKSIFLQGPPGSGKSKSTIFMDELIDLPLEEHRAKKSEAQSHIHTFLSMNDPNDLDVVAKKRFGMNIELKKPEGNI